MRGSSGRAWEIQETRARGPQAGMRGKKVRGRMALRLKHENILLLFGFLRCIPMNTDPSHFPNTLEDWDFESQRKKREGHQPIMCDLAGSRDVPSPLLDDYATDFKIVARSLRSQPGDTCPPRDGYLPGIG
jgi:hypothetical protein